MGKPNEGSCIPVYELTVIDLREMRLEFSRYDGNIRDFFTTVRKSELISMSINCLTALRM
jgi:hypothetical protein